MKAYLEKIPLSTRGEIDLVDITFEVEKAVRESGIKNGQLLVFVPGATGAIVTIENEEGLLNDLKKLIKELAPEGVGYMHDRIDNNAHSHLRATLLGASRSFPIVNGKLVRGTWQQIFFVELDVRPWKRVVIVQIIGE